MLLALVSNPFILSMTIKFLPTILEKHGWNRQGEKEKPFFEKMALTQSDLYDSFVDAWFERELGKFKEQNKIKLKDGRELTKIDLLKFNQDIAKKMLEKNTTYLVLNDKENMDDETTMLRSGLLLKVIDLHCIIFLHDSLRSHFGAKRLFHGILSRSTFALGHPLNDGLLVEQSDLINSLADRVVNNPNLKKLLFYLIEASKYSDIPNAAANAITILNRAGVSLAGRDFSGANIKGADLSGAFLSKTNLSRTDMRDVKLIHSRLSSAKFVKARMDGVEFGQHPTLRFKNEILSCSYSQDGKKFVVLEKDGPLRVYDTSSYRSEPIIIKHGKKK